MLLVGGAGDLSTEVTTTGTPLIGLYGAGTLGREIGQFIEEPFFWVDDTPSKVGTNIDAHEVLRLQDFVEELNYRSADIYICIYQPGFSFLRKRREIADLFPHLNIRAFTDLIFTTASDILPYLFFERWEQLETKLAKYERAFEIFQDDISQNTLRGHLELRTRGDFEGVVWTPRSDVEFLAKHLVPSVTYCDLGAFDGDTAEDFMRLTGDRFGQIIILEPDSKNISRAKARLAGARFPDRITYLQAAVSDRRGETGFRADGNMGSALDPLGEQKVPTMLLSDLDSGGQLYIKMDIEGAEVPALLASIDFIRSRRPLLAVSVYHRPDDLLDTIDILREIPGYSLFLRCHGESGEDLVLYAVPSA